jgi:predicted GIY-YIG superfamily endonuclease
MAIRLVRTGGIQKRWSRYDEFTVAEAPNALGVYEIGNRLRNVIYIGSGRIRERLQAHMSPSGNRCIRQKGKYVRWEQTGSKERAQQRENALLEAFYRIHGRWPECNEAPPRRPRSPRAPHTARRRC